MTPTSAGWQQRALTNSESVRRSEARTIEVAQRLIDHARELMYEGGTPFTITKLVEHVGIAGQTFYRYFPGKDELLLATYEDTIRRDNERIAADVRAEPDPAQRVETMVRAVVRAAANQPNARTVATEHARLAGEHPAVVAKVAQPFRQLLAEAISDGVLAGSMRSPDPVRDARFLADALFVTFQNLALGITTEPAHVVEEHACSFVLGALGVRR